MAVSYRHLIFGASMLSTLSVVLIIVALSTQFWMIGHAYGLDELPDNINYGLFEGTHESVVIGSTKNKIYMTCLMDVNVCAYSCRPSVEIRKQELRKYYDGIDLQLNCNNDLTENGNVSHEVVWYNAGIYVSTFLFLGLGVLSAFLSAVLGIYNIKKNPVEPIWGIFGLYIWNGLSAGCMLLALILWGAHYDINVKQGFAYTKMMYDKTYVKFESQVGWSYWLVFGSMLCHLGAELFLVLRHYYISNEPPPPQVAIEKADDTIFLY